MDKKDLLMTLKIERDYAKRQALQEIGILRGILDKVEQRVVDGSIIADDGLQGNEWRLYKALSNLEQMNTHIKNINELK
ncbi:hypothetical protein CIL05_07165 [Virgibacillus profundi]|uniref:Uncharacterized protein n=1 Tax=Virgibacillus profundi TaxID=2024555 RepID=A0A2A2IGH4_9BACI|nr:hypothetical protein [Virgibacillus profundi]PAV30240.1 hypothetical protein CIL05_07165 [Virgibacillus profundi]PXY54412.1 hypothetical protein CIT14_07250 [Virgibacillus profundi]